MSYTPRGGGTITLDVEGAQESRRDIETVADSLRRLNSTDMSRIGGEADTIGARFAGMGKTIGGALMAVASVAGAGALGAWIKTAIDAADQMGELSEKTGVAVEDVAGLQLAFQMGGLEGDAFTSSMSKLSKEIAAGSSTLGALEIKTRTVGGALASNKDVLYALADRFSTMESGAQKAALAMTLFGESGANMLPLLNGGSKGLREMDDMARKLGLTMSQETAASAGAFNDNLDLLMLGTQGIARGLAAELLPTLSSLSGAFLESMTSGDRLRKVADTLGTGLKLLFTVGVGIVTVFSTVGKTIGAAAGQVVAIMSGDFKLAANIGREWARDIGDSWADTAKTIAAAWSTEGNAAVEGHADILKAQRDLLANQKEREQAAKKAAQQYAASAKTARDFLDSLEQETAQIGLSVDELKMLTAARAAAKAPTAELGRLIMAQAVALTEAKDARELKTKAEQSAAAVADAYFAKLREGVTAIDDQITAMSREIELYGLAETAVVDLALAKAEAAMTAGPASYAELIALDAQIAKLKQLRDLTDRRDVLEARKKAAEQSGQQMQDVWKSVDQTAHDTFVSIFDSGKSTLDRLTGTLKNGLLDLLYQMTAKKWIMNIGATVSTTGGMAGVAQASTGGSPITGSLGSIIGSASGIMTGAVQTAGAILSGQIGLGATLTSGFSAIASGTMSGFMAGASSIVGALGPIALGIGAAVAIWKKLDTSGTRHAGGAASATSAGITAVTAGSLNMERIDTNSSTQKMVGELAQGIVGILDSAALAFGKSAGYQAATAFADDTSKDGAWGSLVISKLGQSVVNWQDTRGNGKWSQKTFADGEKGQEQYLAALTGSVRSALNSIGLPDWARSMLNGIASDASLDDMAKVVDQINLTQRTLRAMSANLKGFADLGDAATTALMAAAGGIEKLAAGADAYYQNFYTEAERSAGGIKLISDSLAQVGVTMPTTIAGYRAEVEARMKLGEAGAPAVAALLAASGAFAQLHPEVAKVTDAVQSSGESTASTALSDARAALSEAYATERNAIQATIDKMGSFASALRGFRDGLLIGDLSPLTPEQKYKEAAAQYDAMLAKAKAGDTVAQEGLTNAATAFLNASKVVNASSAIYQLDFEKVRESTGDMAQWASTQVDIGKASLTALTEQVKGLTAINTSVLSVNQAIIDLAKAMGESGTGVVEKSQSASINSAYQSLLGRDADAGGMQFWKDAMSSGWSGAQVASSIADSSEYKDLQQTNTVHSLYQSVLGRVADQDGMLFWKQAMSQGMSVDQVMASMKESAEYKGLHGSHANGLGYVPFNGYRAELHKGEGVLTAAQNAEYRKTGSFDIAAVVEAIQALRTEVAELRADQRAHTGAIITSNYDANDRAANKVADETKSAAKEAAWSEKTKATLV